MLNVRLLSVKRWTRAFLRRLGGKGAQTLLRRSLTAGFHTNLWTCRRVAEVVRREFDIAQHPDHLGRILHDLGLNP